jgi:mannose-1-phosphate guanylyltransferase
VRNEARLTTALRAALAADLPRGNIVLLGIEPREPDPELGYIVPHGRMQLCGVERFVEKPSRTQAQQLIERGALWNAFIIAADGRALLRLFEERCPDIVAKMRRLVRFEPLLPCPSSALAELYDDLPDLDFSRHVLQGEEKHLQVLAVPECGWSDLGTPERVADALRELQKSAVPLRRTGRSRASVNLAAQHELLHANPPIAHAV